MFPMEIFGNDVSNEILICGDVYYFQYFLYYLRMENEESKRAVVAKDSFLLERQILTGQTFLHLAVRFGPIELVEEMIRFGADVNDREHLQWTPFSRSLLRSVEMVQLFLDNGADIYTRDGREITVHRALLHGSVEVVMFLLEKMFNLQENSEAGKSNRNDFEKCRRIVEILQNGDIDLDWEGYPTLLHFVGRYGDLETFKQVLSRSKHVVENERTPGGNKLLDLLVSAGKINFVQELLKSGIDVNRIYDRDSSTLHYAIMRNYLPMVRLLIDHGANVHYKVDSSYQLLRLAVVSENRDIIDILLNAGADINESSLYKSSIIHLACNGGILFTERSIPNFGPEDPNYENLRKLDNRSGLTLETIKFLIERGADIKAKNSIEITPIMSACAAGRLDIVRHLMDLGVRLDGVDISGYDALHYAILGNNIDLVRFLSCNGFDIRTREKPESLIVDRFYREYSDPSDMTEFIVDNIVDVEAAFSNCKKNPVVREISHDRPGMVVCLLELKCTVKVPQRDKEDCPYFHSYISDRNMAKSLKQFTAYLALKGDDISPFMKFNAEQIFTKPKSFYEDCKLEVERMKNRRICCERTVSYFDFLSKELLDVVPFTSSEELMQVLEAGEYKEEFPCFAFMMEQRIKRVEKLRIYVDLIEQFLQKDYAKQPLSILILGKIFSFWTVGDVRNFGRALTWRNIIGS